MVWCSIRVGNLSMLSFVESALSMQSLVPSLSHFLINAFKKQSSLNLIGSFVNKPPMVSFEME